MSVKYYDEAVVSKIKSLFSNTVFQSRELTFHTVTDKKGSVSFPLISIYRPDGWSISSDNTWKSQTSLLEGLRSIRVDLSYQIDLYANTREDLEDITAELVLYLAKNPGITVEYKSYDSSASTLVSTNLSYVSGPERTSELDDTTVGRPYRYTLVYSLNNAVIISYGSSLVDGGEAEASKITKVEVEIRIIEDLSKNIKEVV